MSWREAQDDCCAGVEAFRVDRAEVASRHCPRGQIVDTLPALTAGPPATPTLEGTTASEAKVYDECTSPRHGADPRASRPEV